MYEYIGGLQYEKNRYCSCKKGSGEHASGDSSQDTDCLRSDRHQGQGNL